MWTEPVHGGLGKVTHSRGRRVKGKSLNQETGAGQTDRLLTSEIKSEKPTARIGLKMGQKDLNEP